MISILMYIFDSKVYTNEILNTVRCYMVFDHKLILNVVMLKNVDYIMKFGRLMMTKFDDHVWKLEANFFTRYNVEQNL